MFYLLDPGQPILNEIQQTGSTYFYFTWFEPITKNGKLEDYNISITSQGPLYPVSEECNVDTALYSYVSSADSTEFNFTEAKPYYNYLISVAAATSAGYGASSDPYFVNTEQAQPEPPANLNINYEEYDLTDYNVTATIRWNAPCETNGILSHFKLIAEGNSTYNNGNDRQEMNLTNTGQFSFSTLYSLQAAYNYTFFLRNILSNQYESVDSTIGLLAPDGCKLLPKNSIIYFITFTKQIQRPHC